MNKILLHSFKASPIVFLLAILFSCSSEPNIGFEVLPKDDSTKLIFCDTTKLVVNTFTDDKLVTGSSKTVIIGNYNDPVFGKTTAEFAAQIAPYSWAEYPAPLVIDSARLYLDYSSDTILTYGDTEKVVDIKAYKLNKFLSNANTYYSSTNADDYNSNVLVGSGKLGPGSKITLKIDDKEEVVARIFIDNDFATSILTNYKAINDSLNHFIKFFKGFVIKTENSDNSALTKFDLSSTHSRFVIFFKDGNQTAQQFVYTFSTSCANFTSVKHNYPSPAFDNININHLYDNQQQIGYLQGLGGFKIKIEIPYLFNWRNFGRIAIIKAELIIKAVDENLSSEDLFRAIPAVYLFGYDKYSNYVYLPEYTNQSYYPAFYSSKREYRFNISNYIQQIFNGSYSFNGLYIVPVNAGKDFTRTMIYTASKDLPNEKQMKLAITYFKL